METTPDQTIEYCPVKEDGCDVSHLWYQKGDDFIHSNQSYGIYKFYFKENKINFVILHDPDPTCGQILNDIIDDDRLDTFSIKQIIEKYEIKKLFK